ncbi:MAG: hypothetical protein AB1468_01495 [Candidatus Micrarchaeota archaeon]
MEKITVSGSLRDPTEGFRKMGLRTNSASSVSEFFKFKNTRNAEVPPTHDSNIALRDKIELRLAARKFGEEAIEFENSGNLWSAAHSWMVKADILAKIGDWQTRLRHV